MTKFKIDELKRVIHVDQVLFGIETFDQVLIKHEIDMDFNSLTHIEILVLKNQLETFTRKDFSWKVGIIPVFGKIPLQLGFPNCFEFSSYI